MNTRISLDDDPGPIHVRIAHYEATSTVAAFTVAAIQFGLSVTVVGSVDTARQLRDALTAALTEAGEATP